MTADHTPATAAGPEGFDRAPRDAQRCVTHHACACHRWMADEFRRMERDRADERRRFVEEELPGLLAKALHREEHASHLGSTGCRFAHKMKAAALAAAIRELL